MTTGAICATCKPEDEAAPAVEMEFYVPADLAQVGEVMAQLVQARRDEYHAEHHAGQHAAVTAMWADLRAAEADGATTEDLQARYAAIIAAGGFHCHHCRDGHDEHMGSCATCRTEVPA